MKVKGIMLAYECGTVKSSSSIRLCSGGESAMQGGWCHSGPSSTLRGLNWLKNPIICHGNKFIIQKSTARNFYTANMGCVRGALTIE